MHQYVCWYTVDYEVFKNKKENEIFKRVELTTNTTNKRNLIRNIKEI